MIEIKISGLEVVEIPGEPGSVPSGAGNRIPGVMIIYIPAVFKEKEEEGDKEDA